MSSSTIVWVCECASRGERAHVAAAAGGDASDPAAVDDDLLVAALALAGALVGLERVGPQVADLQPLEVAPKVLHGTQYSIPYLAFYSTATYSTTRTHHPIHSSISMYEYSTLLNAIRDWDTRTGTVYASRVRSSAHFERHPELAVRVEREAELLALALRHRLPLARPVQRAQYSTVHSRHRECNVKQSKSSLVLWAHLSDQEPFHSACAHKQRELV